MKSTAAIAGVFYDLCKLSFLENPQQKYKLLDSTIIAIAIINATLTLAKDVLLDQITEWIEVSPYFRKLANKASERTKFPKGLDIIAASRFDQVMGRAIVGGLLDEMNFHQRIKAQASDSYNSVRSRIESRFLGRGGTWPAHLWLVSSKSDDSGWLQTHIDRMRSVPTTYIVEFPIWEVLDCKGIYSGKTFKLFIGDHNRDPFILERPDQILGIPEEFVIDVPDLYYQDFKNDVFRAIQELAGIGTWSSRLFLPSHELIEECQIRDNPVTQEVIRLDFYDQEQRLIEYLLFSDILMDSRPRFIHIDIGLVHDRTGIAASRFDTSVTVKRKDTYTGLEIVTRESIFYTDFVMAIEPRAGGEVPIYKIKQLLVDLRKRNYPIARITVDGYQSANLRQDLLLLGFEAEEVSVDRKKDPYLHLKTTILEGRLNCVRHPILDAELRGLVDTGKKIDHRTGTDKSKDLCLHGDTVIQLLNGSMESLRSLHKRGAKDFSVFCYDHQTQRVAIGQVEYVKQLPNTHAALLQVTLGTDESIQATPDHLFLLHSEQFVQADRLREGHLLMSMDYVTRLHGRNNLSAYHEYIRHVKTHALTKGDLSYRTYKDTIFHKKYAVKSVETLTTSEEHVYDLVMKSYHNFALNSGIFVHNCDALAGSLWGAYNTQDVFSSTVRTEEYLSAFEKYLHEDESAYTKLLPYTESIHQVYV